MVIYCPECGFTEINDSIDGIVKYDLKSGCIQFREEDDGWERVPKWKQDHIAREELELKIKKLGI